MRDIKKNLSSYLTVVIITVLLTVFIGGNTTGFFEYMRCKRIIKNNYVDYVSDDTLVNGAYDGMIKSLNDEHSHYIDDKYGLDNFVGDLTGVQHGVGIEIKNTEDKKVVIESVYDDSPAMKVGLLKGDIIVLVDDVKVENLTAAEVAQKVRGSRGEKVKIGVLRGKESLKFEVVREDIVVNTVKTKEVDDLGYIKITTFTENTTKQFEKALNEFKEKRGLIIDLRDNTGGYLTSAKDITSLFLEKGKLLYSLQNKDEIKEVKDDTKEYRDYPIVVLVNSSTASAAEILASSLKDSYGATIVGNITFGKGKVQNLMYYGDTMVKYTSAKWLRPNGECVDGIGIEPDYIENIAVKNNIIYDNQLDKAISLLEE